MQSGFETSDLAQFSARTFRLLKNGLKLESLDLRPEIELPADDEEEEEEEVTNLDDFDAKEEL